MNNNIPDLHELVKTITEVCTTQLVPSIAEAVSKVVFAQLSRKEENTVNNEENNNVKEEKHTQRDPNQATLLRWFKSPGKPKEKAVATKSAEHSEPVSKESTVPVSKESTIPVVPVKAAATVSNHDLKTAAVNEVGNHKTRITSSEKHPERKSSSRESRSKKKDQSRSSKHRSKVSKGSSHGNHTTKTIPDVQATVSQTSCATDVTKSSLKCPPEKSVDAVNYTISDLNYGKSIKLTRTSTSSISASPQVPLENVVEEQVNEALPLIGKMNHVWDNVRSPSISSFASISSLSNDSFSENICNMTFDKNEALDKFKPPECVTLSSDVESTTTDNETSIVIEKHMWPPKSCFVSKVKSRTKKSDPLKSSADGIVPEKSTKMNSTASVVESSLISAKPLVKKQKRNSISDTFVSTITKTLNEVVQNDSNAEMDSTASIVEVNLTLAKPAKKKRRGTSISDILDRSIMEIQNEVVAESTEIDSTASVELNPTLGKPAKKKQKSTSISDTLDRSIAEILNEVVGEGTEMDSTASVEVNLILAKPAKKKQKNTGISDTLDRSITEILNEVVTQNNSHPESTEIDSIASVELNPTLGKPVEKTQKSTSISDTLDCSITEILNEVIAQGNLNVKSKKRKRSKEKDTKKIVPDDRPIQIDETMQPSTSKKVKNTKKRSLLKSPASPKAQENNINSVLPTANPNKPSLLLPEVRISAKKLPKHHDKPQLPKETKTSPPIPKASSRPYNLRKREPEVIEVIDDVKTQNSLLDSRRSALLATCQEQSRRVETDDGHCWLIIPPKIADNGNVIGPKLYMVSSDFKNVAEAAAAVPMNNQMSL